MIFLKSKDESRHRGLFEGVGEQGVGIRGFLGEESVPEDEGENFLNVVGMDRALAVEECGSLGSALEGEGGPGGDGVILPESSADGLAEGEEIALQGFGNWKGG